MGETHAEEKEAPKEKEEEEVVAEGMPPIKMREYGDRKAVEALGAQIVEGPDGARLEDHVGGRPRSDLSAVGVRGVTRRVPLEHEILFRRAAQAYKDAEILGRWASTPGADPAVKIMARVALEEFITLAEAARAGTPFFSGV